MFALLVLSGCPQHIDGGTDEASEPEVVVDASVDQAPASDLTADSAAEAVSQGAFELGVNVTGRNTSAYYSALPEGGELNVEYGPQGLWMVVLAFRTRNVWSESDAELLIYASCRVDGENIGELTLAKQRLLLGGDGWWYYYNLFLVVDESRAAGSEATIEISVEDPSTGQNVQHDQIVSLVGGPDSR